MGVSELTMKGYEVIQSLQEINSYLHRKSGQRGLIKMEPQTLTTREGDVEAFIEAEGDTTHVVVVQEGASKTVQRKTTKIKVVPVETVAI